MIDKNVFEMFEVLLQFKKRNNINSSSTKEQTTTKTKNNKTTTTTKKQQQKKNKITLLITVGKIHIVIIYSREFSVLLNIRLSSASFCCKGLLFVLNKSLLVMQFL